MVIDQLTYPRKCRPALRFDTLATHTGQTLAHGQSAICHPRSATITGRFNSRFEHLRLKRYLPNGRDSFSLHVDVMEQAAARRFMTAILYLNAVEGGQTVFPGLDVAIAPAPGKLVAFPPLWLFPHAGLPPRSDPKYILHTYLCYPV
jgi:hypothetical protein